MSKIQLVSQEEKSSAKVKYRVTNWSAYNQALINRGNITFYFEESVLDDWYDDGPHQQGAQFVYSDLCIETLMLLKVLFKLPYRQTQGFAMSLLSLLEIDDLAVPSYSQIQRRASALQIRSFDIPRSESLHIAIDSTGLKIYGEGEWKVRKHGYSKRRTWRKLHLGVDAKTGFIYAHSLTENDMDDGSQLEPLMEQIEEPVEAVSADGAYDQEKCWDYLYEKYIDPLIPPRENAVYWVDENGELLDYPRNEVLEQVEQHGRKEWKQNSGYHQRSLSETAMYRFKMIHGPVLFSRKLSTQKVEAILKVKLINRMTALGMPVAEMIEIE